ncbi:MAG TPA: aspartate aminotransferase family protein, partial [Pyrinomonadaceae bacterium]
GNGHAASADVRAAGAQGNGAGANGRAAGIESAPYVPFKPIQGRAHDELTPGQRQYVTELVERYVRRTRRSRELIQATRARHADSRLAIGFRQLWKDLVYPIVGERAQGANIWDADGNEYVDVTMGFGVHLFGHAPQFINEAIAEQLSRGASVGPQSRSAGEAAELLCELTGVERVAFCNSGTEANMSAIRLARAATGRDKIAMFAGSYHGSFDATLARALARGGGAVPLSPGVPARMIEDVLVLEYDTPEALSVLRERGHELAAVIVEPVQSRRPELQPSAFLAELRRLTEQSGTVLIFDEVITGLRLHPGGAQSWFGVRADLATYGKVLGGGLPVGAVGGRAALLDAIDGGMWQYGDSSYPSAQQAYFAGTFFKHPLVMTAARAVLAHLRDGGPSIQERLNRQTDRLAARLNEFFAGREMPARVVHFGSLFRFAFGREVKWPDFFFYQLIEQGVYVWEGRNCFLSTAHTDADLERVTRAVMDAADQMRRVGFFPPPGDGDGRARQVVESSNVTHAHGAAAAAASTTTVTTTEVARAVDDAQAAAPDAADEP